MLLSVAVYIKSNSLLFDPAIQARIAAVVFGQGRP